MGLQIQEPQQDSTLEEWWLESRRRVSKPDKRKYDSMIALVARSLWKQRNSRVFNNARLQSSPDQLVEAIGEELRLWEIVRVGGSTIVGRE
jgi:hypothetical protein